MKATFFILFYLRKNRPDKNGLVPIMEKITINGERVQFGVNLKIDPKLWDSKNGKAFGRSAEATNLNRVLEGLKVRTEELYNSQLKEKGYIRPDTIRDILLGVNNKQNKSLIEIFSEHNNHYKQKVGITTSQKTYSRYELTKNKLLEFMNEKYNSSDIMLPEINFIFVENFYLYLCQRGCNNNTAMKFIQRFRTVFNFAINSGIEIKVNPFAQYKFRYDEVSREVLTQEEINTIYDKKLESKRISQVRDLFIFCCYTGLAYADATKLTESHIKKSFDDKLWIMTKRTKTNNDSNIMLLDIPIKIIDKYRGKDKDGKLIPSCSNQKMNEYLKEIATICNIDKVLSTHMRRHRSLSSSLKTN